MDIVKETEQYCSGLLKEKIPASLTYHNYQHTLNVVNAAKEIAKAENLGNDEMEVLLVAAWFHDTGYTQTYLEHEEAGKKIAEEFLVSKGKNRDFIDKVNACIDATKVPQKPMNKVAAVLSDADAFHLADDKFLDISMELRKEWNNATNRNISKKIFLEQSLSFIKNHNFHTEYGKTVLAKAKEKNTEKLENILEKRKKKKEKKKKEAKNLESKVEKLEEKLKKSKYSGNVPTRGIESMFRLTARNQINLSSIADNKANIMITINSLILSAVVTLLIRKIAENPNLIIPTFILFIVCIVSIVFAILATRPKISEGKFTREDIKNHKVNLLFFGNFYNMDLNEYTWAVKEMMKDYDHLYSNMIKDQYFLGKVLARKYKMIRTCYTVFMFGFVASIIAFAIAMIYFPPPA